jgi:chromosome partitioning protein
MVCGKRHISVLVLGFEKVTTISLASAKGGVGKSTLAILIAAELALAKGWRVTLLDSDLNQHASAFGRKARIPGLQVFGDITEDTILPTLRQTEAESDVVIIDLAGGSSTLALMALQRSHFVLVPTQTSLPDTRDAMKTIAQIDNAQELARAPIGRALIWTRVPTQFESRESKHLRKSLEGRGVNIFGTALMERNSIRTIHMTGKVPRQSNPKDKGSSNVAEITDELLRQLELMEREAA